MFPFGSYNSGFRGSFELKTLMTSYYLSSAGFASVNLNQFEEHEGNCDGVESVQSSLDHERVF